MRWVWRGMAASGAGVGRWLVGLGRRWLCLGQFRTSGAVLPLLVLCSHYTP